MTDLEKYKEKAPKVHSLPDFDPAAGSDWGGIRAFWFEGAAYQGKKTKVFAYIGYPEEAAKGPVPGIVLLHGGGGHAFPEWVRQWNRRGFAAIAIDTEGYFPAAEWKGLTVTEEGSAGSHKYTHELYGDLAEDGYTTGPRNVGMRDFDEPVGDQWMYHAIAGSILAHSILLADEHVDPAKTGLCGISWGSVVASAAVGYDDRYAFAIPIYGSGYLDEGPCPQLPRVFSEPKVKELWSAADRFALVKYPVLWKCWISDTAFSIAANSKSYLATAAAGSCLAIDLEMRHSHYHAWVSPEPYRFADGITKGYLPLIRPKVQPEGFGEISFEIETPEDFSDVSANIRYLTEPMVYDENDHMTSEWKTVAAGIDDGLVSGTVPDGACAYFVEMSGIAGGIRYVTDSALIMTEK